MSVQMKKNRLEAKMSLATVFPNKESFVWVGGTTWVAKSSQILALNILSTQLDLFFFVVLSSDITANCIGEINCLALDGFDLYTVHKLSSKEKKYCRSQISNPRLLGGKQECFLSALSQFADTGQLQISRFSVFSRHLLSEERKTIWKSWDWTQVHLFRKWPLKPEGHHSYGCNFIVNLFRNQCTMLKNIGEGEIRKI